MQSVTFPAIWDRALGWNVSGGHAVETLGLFEPPPPVRSDELAGAFPTPSPSTSICESHVHGRIPHDRSA